MELNPMGLRFPLFSVGSGLHCAPPRALFPEATPVARSIGSNIPAGRVAATGRAPGGGGLRGTWPGLKIGRVLKTYTIYKKFRNVK